MGAAAAPAASALAAALDDEDVRFPALHALEAIGVEAFAAAPSVAALLSDDDHFVRLAATYALAGMARSPSWDDVVLGYDPEDVSPHVRAIDRRSDWSARTGSLQGHPGHPTPTQLPPTPHG